jgi:ribosomal protein L6P/L9E
MVKFLGKTKVLLFGFDRSDLLAAASLVKEKRTINIFTGRGVRFSKQVIYKKQGKVSSYR